MFLLSIFIIGILSVTFAYISLRKELNKSEHKKAQEVQESLKKGRVLFYSPSSSSDTEA